MAAGAAAIHCGAVPEIVERILSFVKDDVDLASAAAVSRLWNSVAVLVRWRFVDLGKDQAALLALSPATVARIRPRSVTLDGCHLNRLPLVGRVLAAAGRTVYQWRTEEQESIPVVGMALRPEVVRELDLALWSATDTAWVEQLLVMCGNLESVALWEVTERLTLAGLPALQSLRRLWLSAANGDEEAMQIGVEAYRNMAKATGLEQLCIEDSTAGDGTKLEHLQCLPSLTRLKVGLHNEYQRLADVEPLLRAVGKNLTTLSLDLDLGGSYNDEKVSAAATALAGLCPNLRVFVKRSPVPAIAAVLLFIRAFKDLDFLALPLAQNAQFSDMEWMLAGFAVAGFRPISARLAIWWTDERAALVGRLLGIQNHLLVTDRDHRGRLNPVWKAVNQVPVQQP